MRRDPDVENGACGKASWLCPGATCWRRARARRATLLHDGAAYFTAARGAILKARRSVLLIGWSFDPRTRLMPDREGAFERETMADLLRRLKTLRPQVAIRLLIWDMPWPINAGKDLSPDEIRAQLEPGVDYRIDSCLPFGACQHQKLLIIDDRVAFCGGTDFEADRWDTAAHRDPEPRRRLPSGETYTPRHDVMMLVDGEAAAALGELARTRWAEATAERIAPVAVDSDVSSDPWPDGLAAAFADVPVAIARTVPARGARAAIRESEALYRAAIAAATRVIYLENQYFASPLIADALAERLAEPEGPEIVVVVAACSPNTFDRITMDSSRRDLIQHLRAADRHDRLRILAPHAANGTPILVHSKVAVFDDRLLRVGSSNLNNRSFGYDTECDLAIEALAHGRDDAHRAAVTGALHGLLAHHAGMTRAVFERALRDKGSIRAVLDDPKVSARLRPIDAARRGPIAWLVETLRLGDPVGMEDAWRPWRRPAALRRARTAMARAAEPPRGVASFGRDAALPEP